MNDRAAPTTSTVESVEITDPDARARGRNNWFHPRHVCVQRCTADRTIVVTVQSSRPPGDVSPIYVSLPLDDARRIREALGRQIAALDAASAEEPTP